MNPLPTAAGMVLYVTTYLLVKPRASKYSLSLDLAVLLFGEVFFLEGGGAAGGALEALIPVKLYSGTSE